MIQFDSVTKRYGSRRSGTEALRSVSFAIPRGSAFAVVGPNGAGKTTLFAVMLGFLRPTSGSISIDDATPRDYVRRHGVGYVPERFAPPPQWRVRDALRALARLDRAPRGHADEAIERWGLADHADMELGELSHGLLQRVGLAQALMAPRELVVLDEPAEGLDPIWRVRLRETVLELRDEGRTVLIASHDLAEVERVTGHALLLDAGRVRDVLETRPAATPSAYEIRLTAPSDGFMQAFPGAIPAGRDDRQHEDDERAGGAERAASVYRVVVRDADELSARLAAAIATGARIIAVEPLHEPLEERVRRVLGESPA